MCKSFLKFKKNKGFTLIESIVLLFIFSVVSVVFLQVYIVGSQIIIDSKNRLGAVALANQKMEIIRSIDYEQVGTKFWNGSTWVYGIPGGELLQSEDISINTRNYQVTTFVQYIDDAFDGTSPIDTIPTDYKRVRVQVSWGDEDHQKVTLFGNFTPNGLETAVAGGTLSINVLHADGSGVVGASVNVTNNAGTINVNGVTDASGNLSLPGTPAATQGYIITVSKNDYFNATTFPPYPTTSYNPVDIHATVVLNTLNQFSIVMDRVVSIPLHMVDPYDQPIPDINFSFIGGRVLGTNPSTGVNVVTVNDTSRTTNGSGEYTYQNQSYGLYNLTLGSSSATNYELYKVIPESSATANQIDVTPGNTGDYKVVLLNKAFASLKVILLDEVAGTPVSGASVQLESSDGTYDVSGTSDQYGLVFFPTSTTPLVAGEYTVSVSATGYGSETATVTIDQALMTEEILLTAN